jgi:DNA polymerase III subunit delta'
MLIGHEKIYNRLKAEVDAGILHHAHLFLGPECVGKTKAALNLAVYMQGAEGDGILGRQILEGADADTLIFLDEGETLPIKTIRAIVERTGQTHNRPYLIVVIENIGRMRIESMNALLKTLEEPPAGIVFFLTANKEEDVIPTIRSRCRVNNFHTVSEKLLRKECDGHVFEEQLTMFAMGRPGKLKRLIDDGEYFEAHQEMYQEVNQFLDKPTTHDAFALIRKYEKSEMLQEVLDILLHRVRTFALAEQSPVVLEHLDFPAIMDNIEVVKQDLDRNVNTKLLLENLFLPFAP